MDDLQVESDGSTRGARLFANRTFKKGGLVYNFGDAPLSPIQTYQTIQVSASEHILVDETLAKLNHACGPNVLVNTHRRLVVALRDIPPGEELTYFYPSTEWEMEEPFFCQCGSPRCLGWINGARHLSVGILENYYINPHIRALVHHALTRKISRIPFRKPAQMPSWPIVRL